MIVVVHALIALRKAIGAKDRIQPNPKFQICESVVRLQPLA
jgi:hypothetical protein